MNKNLLLELRKEPVTCNATQFKFMFRKRKTTSQHQFKKVFVKHNVSKRSTVEKNCICIFFFIITKIHFKTIAERQLICQ